jgi:phosphoglycerate kinase
MTVKRLEDLELAQKRVLIRADLNVPMKDGAVTSTARIDASIGAVQFALNSGARVMIMSHLGRPGEGKFDSVYSLQPVANYLGDILGRAVPLVSDYLERTPQLQSGDVVLLENVRFNRGETSNDPGLARRYAALCDIYVMDAFGTAHRAQASTHGVGLHATEACAGPLLWAELDALGKALENPRPPLVAVVGGAKVSTKLTVLESLSEKVDQLVPGGGIANTLIAAAGFPVGKSLYEPDLVARAKRLIELTRNRGGDIPIPLDVVVAKSLSADAQAEIRMVEDVGKDDMIFDIGPKTIETYGSIMSGAGTVVWNGPVGVFEFEQFSRGTRELGKAIAGSSAYSIAGGGDTLAAIEKFQYRDQISYISTGGGAFLEFLEGKTLPVVEMLQSRSD